MGGRGRAGRSGRQRHGERRRPGTLLHTLTREGDERTGADIHVIAYRKGEQEPCFHSQSKYSMFETLKHDLIVAAICKAFTLQLILIVKFAYTSNHLDIIERETNL